MSNTATIHVLVGPLHRLWNETGHLLFESTGSSEATAPEVQAFINEMMSDHSNISLVLRYWNPLSPTERDEAIALAFPVGTYSNGEDREIESVIQRMRLYVSRFDELMNLVQRKPLSKEQKEASRDLLKGLKADMDEEIRYGNRHSGEVSEIEKNFFYPAILNAHATLRARANTGPLSWHSDLYSARIDIKSLLRQLEGIRK